MKWQRKRKSITDVSYEVGQQVLQPLPLIGKPHLANKQKTSKWWTGPPGHREKFRWAGPPEWVIFWLQGPLAHYNKLTKFRNV